MKINIKDGEKVKVFSAEKFYADEGLLGWLKDRSRASGWPDRADGKTEEECNLSGFMVHPDWMEER